MYIYVYIRVHLSLLLRVHLSLRLHFPGFTSLWFGMQTETLDRRVEIKNARSVGSI